MLFKFSAVLLVTFLPLSVAFVITGLPLQSKSISSKLPIPANVATVTAASLAKVPSKSFALNAPLQCYDNHNLSAWLPALCASIPNGASLNYNDCITYGAAGNFTEVPTTVLAAVINFSLTKLTPVSEFFTGFSSVLVQMIQNYQAGLIVSSPLCAGSISTPVAYSSTDLTALLQVLVSAQSSLADQYEHFLEYLPNAMTSGSRACVTVASYCWNSAQNGISCQCSSWLKCYGYSGTYVPLCIQGTFSSSCSANKLNGVSAKSSC